MKLKNRQIKFLEALAEAGVTSPVSRQELVAACEATGVYSCPPSWITQDSNRKAGRGLYDLPELLEVSGDVPAAAPLRIVSPLLLLSQQRFLPNRLPLPTWRWA